MSCRYNVELIKKAILLDDDEEEGAVVVLGFDQTELVRHDFFVQ